MVRGRKDGEERWGGREEEGKGGRDGEMEGGGGCIVGLGGLCPKKALLCYAAMPAGRSIMLNPEAYYAWNMPTYAYE